MQIVYNLFFNNDASECEHYGTFATEAAAEAEIAAIQAEYGEEAFATDAFDITENTVRA
jgi:hypothetical protein